MSFELFDWSERFLTGISLIDEQHQQLVALINRLGEVVLKPNAARLAEIVAEVSDYASYHFRCEETIWEEGLSDPVGLARHLESHFGFVAQIGQLQQNAGDEVVEEALLLHRFLSSWLIHHILGEDREMALSMISGGSPTVLVGASNSETILLQAIQNLYSALTTVNKRLSDANDALRREQALSPAHPDWAGDRPA
jgi:hemerythrin-like metal-binding protein